MTRVQAKTLTVVIDAGHQAKANLAKEPIGPGSRKTKYKVTVGTSGRWTKKREATINLQVAKRLRKELKARGYNVIMTREVQDVNISNRQRAEIANDAKADLLIHLHCDGSTSSARHGASILAPASNNPFLKKKNIKASQKVAKTVLTYFCKATGAKYNGVSRVNTMSGINWSKVPVCLIEMGFMTNKKEDKNLASRAYQIKCAKGMANGIDKYFGVVKTDTMKNLKVINRTDLEGAWIKAIGSKVKNATGYYFQIATKSNFESGSIIKKEKTVKGQRYKNFKLDYATTYYVRARAYRTSNGKNYYGGWSPVRKITTVDAPVTPEPDDPETTDTV